MSPLLQAVTRFVETQGGGEGYFELPTASVHVLRSFHRVEANHRVYRPSLCIVLQGAKQILYGDAMLDYGAMQCLVINMELPATGRILAASADEPFLGVTIDFDVARMREVLEQMDSAPSPAFETGSALFVANVEDPLADCVLRIIKMAETPKAIPILYPSVEREIYYWLLSGPHGSAFCKIALPDSHMERIARAIQLLRENFTTTLRVEHLAEAAGMSPSSFHQHFKKLTAMTPLQYQKQLRLLEARRLMITDAISVTEAAYQVGYESASQFSREYSRTFGITPKRSVTNLRGETRSGPVPELLQGA